ncbi:MAG: hypothetical protein PHR00_00235 [Patescibacteria group bacterium]|nr:hypothetical protein [Patescibacteria group bacterium]
MKIKNSIANFIPFTITVSIGLALEALVKFPATLLWLVLGFALIANFLAALIICKKNDGREWYNFAIMPAILAVSVTTYVTIIDKPWLLQTIISILLIATYLYWRFVFFYFNQQSRYTSFSLESLSYYANTVIVFLAGSSALGLKSLLSLRVWQVFLPIAIILLVVVYQSLWVSKFSLKKELPFLFIAWLVLLELFFVLILLPNDYNMLGAILASSYYFVIMIVSDILNKEFNKFKLKSYSAVILIGWITLFATAVWL